MSPILEVERISVSYDDVQVLKEVSLQVHPGEFVALVGPNGAGKTTLMRTIMGLLHPRSGAIRLEGRRIDGLPPYEIAAAGVAAIPEGRHLFGEMTVQENLELGAYLPHARTQQAQTVALINRLFPVLSEKASEQAEHLSGGEQQMVAIARGLMSRPRVLLLDDPFLGLARNVIGRFCQALRVVTDQGLTVLATGQHVRRLLRLAHRAYLLDEGRMILEGSGAELLESERVRHTLLEFTPQG